MNILLICDHFPPYSVGGAEISAFNLGEGLSNIGHNVSVLTRYPKKLSVEFENFHAIYSVTYKAIPFKYYFCNSALSSIRLSKKLLYLLKTEDFDIVHAQNWISAYSVMRAKQKMKKFPPSVLTIRDYSYVCPLNDALCLTSHLKIRCNLFKMIKCKFVRMKNDKQSGSLQILGLIPFCIFHYIDYRMLERTLSSFDAYITCSDFVRSVILNNSNLKENEVHTVYNAIDVDQFKTCFKNNSNSNTILYVGRLSPEKGVECLIKSIPNIIKEYQDCSFVIIGDGPIRRKLEKKVKELDIQKYIIFMGFISYDRIKKYYQIADIVVVPSIWNEPFGRTLIEAMACRKPLIASRVGGIPEIIKHEETGLLVECGNSSELASAILTLLKDKEMRESMGKQGRMIVEEHYDKKVFAEKVIRIYESILYKK